MKFFITMGGCLGFVLTLASSLHAGNAPASALSDAGFGCIAAAILFRAAHSAFFSSLQSHVRERAAAMQQAAAETAGNTP